MFTGSVTRTLVVSITLGFLLATVCTPVQARNPESFHAGRKNLPSATTASIYTQPPSGSATLFASSRWADIGSDYDQYVWDDFALQSTHVITEVRWRGGYDPAYSTAGPLSDFTIDIYPSIAAGTQPDVNSPPLAHYQAGGSAGETSAGMVGGTALYDYAFTLPTPFTAVAGTTYWLQIEAIQLGIPNWGFVEGNGGNGKHFRRTAAAGDVFYTMVPGDTAFSLLGSSNSSYLYIPMVIEQ